MKRQRMGQSSSQRWYHRELLHAIGKFLPHGGLSLQSRDGRVRWTDRLLVVTAMLMAWQTATSLKDAFESCWQVVTGTYPTRRRAGYTYEGFIKALQKRSPRLLPIVASALRQAVQSVAWRHWKIQGWVVLGVDGSRIECPRTAAHEAAFGCAGKDKTTPQQFVTTVLHVGTGLIWDWRRGGGKEAERNHLRQMIATLPDKAILLADAGFTGYELLRELQAGGRSFIIRAGGNVRRLKKLGFSPRERDGIVYLWPLDHRKAPPRVLRLVVVHDGRKPVCLLTNILEESELSDSQVATLYRRRWGMEVFYRSLKRTMERHKMHSTSPDKALVELDWALAGLWMLGLLTVQRMIRRRGDPMQWSVAQSLRVVRRVMSGRGSRQAAQGLYALSQAVKDTYRRRGSKKARNWPHKKTESPPGPPKIRTAKRWEKRKAQRFKRPKAAA
ncbi:MAG: IS4 family transposase [Phycisphaerae bacterium]|jgi:hypothetical protein